ncbi:MAG: molybdopterin molybdenumtransferase MoeA, partial [Bacteroidota bacterium]
HLGDARIVGLPGNPVSAYICAALFLRPMLYALAGRTDSADEVEAPLGVPLPANGPRRDHLRATMTDGAVHPLDVQDSGQLAALAHADALIIRPPGAEPKKAGESVPIIRLDRA